LEVEPALEGPAPITNGPRKMSEHSRNSQYPSTRLKGPDMVWPSFFKPIITEYQSILFFIFSRS
jgi:hypothetical protein